MIQNFYFTIFRKFSSIHLRAFCTLAQGQLMQVDLGIKHLINGILLFQLLHGICNERLAVSKIRLIFKRYGISCNDMCLRTRVLTSIELFLTLILFLVRRKHFSDCLWNGCVCGL